MGPPAPDARDLGALGRWAGLAAWLVACFAAAAFGGIFGPGEWYASLRKPSFNPPAWVFGPVWTLLYAAMAVAAWRVWARAGFTGAPLALGMFLVQLLWNALWSWLFFGLHRPGLALADILLLWISIAACVALFARHDRLAAGLLVPYLAWVSFAAVLNAALWRLNP